MRTDDPWRLVVAPPELDAINARRIPEVGSQTWGLYWAVDARKQCLLILQHGASTEVSARLPKLQGLLVEATPTEDETGRRVIIRLTDGEQREIFQRFCVDIVEATRLAESDEEAVERFLARTWRWHRLLRSGHDGRLSDDEQKGLIGELRLLETHLLSVLPAGDAVEGWAGPTGAPKDFQVGRLCIEAKALNPMKAEVAISSIDQLDAQGASRLFLYVTEVIAATGESRSAATVIDMARQIRSAIEAQDPSATIAFEARLNAVGFDWEDDYSDRLWVVGEEMLYEVAEEFPRVTPSMVPPGVDNVRYAIALAACEEFRAEMDTLTQAIAEARNAS